MRHAAPLYWRRYRAPQGFPLVLAATDTDLCAVSFSSDPDAFPSWLRAQTPRESPDHSILIETVRQFDFYLRGGLRDFNLPLAPRGTAFQHRVWDRLRAIPYGETRSYRDIASAIGSPNAVRAVGRANGTNPLPIVVPCHRVIASDGSLCGFGGGLDIKRCLLELERSVH
jgi:methylated-DNA-[protein]-cysteine S-methyltransferase